MDKICTNEIILITIVPSKPCGPHLQGALTYSAYSDADHEHKHLFCTIIAGLEHAYAISISDKPLRKWKNKFIIPQR